MKKSTRKNIAKIALTLVFSAIVCTLVLTNGNAIVDWLFNDAPSTVSENNTTPTPPTKIDSSGAEYLSTIGDHGGIEDGKSTFGAGYSWEWNDIDSGKFHIIFADKDGFVFTRGSNEHLQLGLAASSSNRGTSVPVTDTSSYYTYFQPVVALNHLHVTKVSAGGYHSLAIGYDYTKTSTTASAYKVYAWGRQEFGAVGNGSTSSTPTGVPQDITSRFNFASDEYPTDVSAGEYQSLLMTNKGNIWGWGGNSLGQVGCNSTSTIISTPQKLSLTNVKAISAGSEHSMALNTSNKLYTWGGNLHMQLGGNSTTTTIWRSPTAVFTSNTFTDISAGELHSAALDGTTLYTWGDNRGGKLGIGSPGTSDPYLTSNMRSALQKVSGTFTAVSAGGANTLAISGGKLMCTGYGVDQYFGKTADGTFQDTGLKSNYISNGGMMLNVNENNQMWAWGYAARYDENWFGRTVKTLPYNWSDGKPAIDTTPPVSSLHVIQSTSEYVRRLTPPANIIGLPTNLNRTSPQSSLPADDTTFYNSRVKINYFYSSFSNFAIAQVTKDVYDSGGSFSGAAWKTLSRKGIIIDRKGYYVVRYYRGSTTSGSLVYTKFKISNNETEVIESSTNPNTVTAFFNVFDGIGIKTIRATGTQKVYDPKTGTYSTGSYDSGIKNFATGVYNDSFEIKANSNSTFALTVTDYLNNTYTKNVTVNTVVSAATLPITATYDGTAKSVSPKFFAPAHNEMTLSQFNTRYGSNGYTVSAVNYSGGTNFTPGTTAPKFASTNEYYASYAIRKGGADVLTHSVSIIINKRSLSISANNQTMVYGDPQPALTYTTTSGSLATGDSITGALTRASGNNVGSYNITQGTLSVTNADSYYLTVYGASLTINKRTLAISADNKTKTYGDSDPALTYTVTSGSKASFDSYSGALTRAAGNGVGNYTISQGAFTVSNISNYNFSFASAVFSITKRNVTVTADALLKTYGSADPTLTYSLTSGTLVSGDSFSGSLTRVSGENTGTYNINVGSLTLGGNYNMSFVGNKLTINPKALTIRAANKTITYGDAPPIYTVSYEGLVSGDSFIDTLLCSYTQYSNAGTYAITIQSNSYPNYTPTVVNGTLTVNKKAVTIKADNKTINYKGAIPSLTISYTGLINGDTLTDTATTNYTVGSNAGTYTITVTPKTYTNYTPTYQTGVLTVNKIAAVLTGATTQSYEYNGAQQNIAVSLNHSETTLAYSPQQGYKDYGTYLITVSAAETTNYFAVSSEFTLSITRKTLTINADEMSKEYGDEDPELTYTVIGLAPNDSMSGKLSRSSGQSVGDYEIYRGTLTGGNNYAIVFNSNIFHITRRSITITAVAQSKEYGTMDPVLGYQITAGSIANEQYLNGTLTRVAGEYVGEYDILQGTVTNANNSNYNITFISKKFTITKKPIGITVNWASKTYGEADPVFTYEITSGTMFSGDNLTGSLSREPGDDAGEYRILLGSLNNDNYVITMNTAMFIINKKAITAKPADVTLTYGDAVPVFEIVYNGLVAGDSLTDTVTTSYKRYDNVGTFGLIITPKEHTNYTVTNTMGILTVNKLAVTIKADDKSITYGDVPPTYTITYVGLVNNDVLNDTASAPYEQYGAVGTYAITVTPNTYTNYIGNYQAGVLTVNDRKISITGHGSKTYGDAEPTITYSIVSGALVSGDSLSGKLSRVAGEDAGSYAITMGSLGNENYEITLIASLFVIYKKDITIKANNATVTYGDALPTFTVTYTGLVNGDTLTDTVTTTYKRYDDAGTFTLSVTPKSYTNYEANYLTGTLTVQKRNVTIKADNKSITYGDNPPAYTISYTGLVNGDTLSDTASAQYARYGNAGSYTISVALKTYTNYAPTYQTGTLTVGKKAATVTAQNKSITYGDALPEFTFVYSGLINNDTLIDTASTTYVRYGDVGVYDITVNPKTHTNYILTTQKGQLTVNKKALTIIVDDLTIEYASAVPEFTFTYYGLENNDNLGDEAYTDYTQYAAVGTYYIRIRDNTYTNYIPTFINGTLTVAKATGRVLGDKVQNYTYNGTQILLDVTLNHSEAPLNFAPAQGYVNAGSYQITVTSPETVNYTAVSEVFTLIIDKRELRVNIDSKEKIYGESDPALDFTYSNLLSGDVVTGALARTAGEDVGDYAINAGTVSAGQNYVTVITEAYLVIKQRPLTITAHAATKIYGDAEPAFEYSITSGNLVGSDTLSGKLSREPGIYVGTYELNIGTLGNSNYAITFVPEFLTITKRPITITADDMTKVYGDADPELSYSITSGSLAYDDTISAAVARAEGEDVGVYAISIVQSENNSYEISYEGNSFTIVPRPITITADAKTKIYGDSDPEFTYTITMGNTVFDDTLAGSLTRVEGENKGVYDILRGSVTNANNSNYDIAYISNRLTIDPRPLTIAAVDKQKTYGDADPALEYEIQTGNLVFSDTLSGAIAREAGEDVNIYTIHKDTLRNDNYNITFIDGEFEIIRRNITVTAKSHTKTYGNNEPPLLYDITTGNLVGNDKLNGVLVRPAEENVGSYPITQGTLTNENNPNYNITFVGNTFVITKRSITITANNISRAYGETDPALTYSVTQGSLGFTDRLTGVLSRDEGESLGKYVIRQGTLTNENNPNYSITFVEGEFTITQRAIGIRAISTSKIYGDIDPILGYEIISGSTAFDEQLVGSVARMSGENVGTYTIHTGSVNNANNPNYIIFFENGVFSINQRPITITPDALKKTYGYDDPEFTFTITQGNLVFEDTVQGKLNRNAGESTGFYDITVGTLREENSNYDITLEPVQFEIEQRLIVIIADAKNKIYGNHDPEFTYGLYGGTMVPGDRLEGQLGRQEGEDVGVYAITMGTLNNSNYEIVIVAGNLIISPRPITITANSMSFLHGSAERIDLTYTISGEPLPEDEELIASAISITSSARPDSYVGNYPIYLNQIRPLNNYTVTMINSVLKILNGDITDVYFEDMKVLYDGYEQVLLASGEVSKYNVEYKNNAGTEVGVYRATAIFTKENYNDLVLEAKLIIMTNKISTSEIIPQGIITIESGVDPYVVPIIVNNSDIKTLEHAEELITLDKEIGESVKSITNINLFSNGAAIPLDGVAEVRMLIPSNITDVSTLRIAFVSGDTTYDVAYEIDGEYIVFEAYELGDYAFITETHETKEGDRVASVLLYVGIGVLVFILVGFIATGFTIKRRKRDQAKYI